MKKIIFIPILLFLIIPFITSEEISYYDDFNNNIWNKTFWDITYINDTNDLSFFKIANGSLKAGNKNYTEGAGDYFFLKFNINNSIHLNNWTLEFKLNNQTGNFFYPYFGRNLPITFNAGNRTRYTFSFSTVTGNLSHIQLRSSTQTRTDLYQWNDIGIHKVEKTNLLNGYYNLCYSFNNDFKNCANTSINYSESPYNIQDELYFVTYYKYGNGNFDIDYFNLSFEINIPINETSENETTDSINNTIIINPDVNIQSDFSKSIILLIMLIVYFFLLFISFMLKQELLFIFSLIFGFFIGLALLNYSYLSKIVIIMFTSFNAIIFLALTFSRKNN